MFEWEGRRARVPLFRHACDQTYYAKSSDTPVPSKTQVAESGYLSNWLQKVVDKVSVFNLVVVQVEFFNCVTNGCEHISERPLVRTLISAKFTAAHIENAQLFEFAKHCFEAVKACHSKPVARQIKLFESLKIEHVLEVEAILRLDTVQWKAQLLDFGTIDGLDQVPQVVNDAHSDQLETLKVVEREYKVVEVLENLVRRRLVDHPAVHVFFLEDAGIHLEMFQGGYIASLLGCCQALYRMGCILDRLHCERLKSSELVEDVEELSDAEILLHFRFPRELNVNQL